MISHGSSVPSSPLDPSAFLDINQRPISKNWADYIRVWDDSGCRTPVLPPAPYTDPKPDVACTLATIAHIPPGQLRHIYKVFRDDGIGDQPDWLSQAVKKDKYRMLHGIRCRWLSSNSTTALYAPTEVTLLNRTNRTTVDIKVASPKFKAPTRYDNRPAASIVPPVAIRHGEGGWGVPVELFGISSHMRSLNGFFDTKLGKVLTAVGKKMYRIGRKDPKKINKQIGSTIQLWVAPDGCKCFAFMHNYFPKYSFYVDGLRLTKEKWQQNADFRKFDGYDIDVEWQPFLAFLVHGTLKKYSPPERYPGAASVGWYSGDMGTSAWQWCEESPPPYLIEFGTPPDLAARLQWWGNLESYLRSAEEIFARYSESAGSYGWWADFRGELGALWTATHLRQRQWEVWRPRPVA